MSRCITSNVTMHFIISCDTKYVGLGEGMEDLQPFDPVAFAEALV